MAKTSFPREQVCEMSSDVNLMDSFEATLVEAGEVTDVLSACEILVPR